MSHARDRRHRLLVTNDPELGEGPLGVVATPRSSSRTARVAAVEPAGAAADERIDAAGRCVIPGFVDSHTHLVFAGDRGDEFAARMAGRRTRRAGSARPRPPGPPPTTSCSALGRARRRGAAPGITHVEIKSGYGLDVATDEARCLRWPPSSPTT